MRKEILDIQKVLSDSAFLVFTKEEKEALLAASLKIRDRLNILSQQVLTAGLLGGTGVGKSMVMNALAGVEISSTSHRRPHTHQVIIYRHEHVERPAFLENTAVPWHEIIHKADPIRQIILCDLPDFDSLLEEHRDRVTGFLELLDIVIWVTSPEKYADNLFYSFLKSVPKARHNFYFVLNKTDLLFQGSELEPAYQELSALLALFLQYLQKSGIQEPLLYTISAQEAFQLTACSPWNQFPGFRKEIFRQREAKEITTIKSANLDQEIRQLHSRLHMQRLHLNTLQNILNDFVLYLNKERRDWEQAGWNILSTWIDMEMKAHIMAHLENLTHLVGPGYWIARLIRELKDWKEDKTSAANLFSTLQGYGPPEGLRDQLERLENRLTHQLLQRSLPEPLRDQLLAALNFKKAWDDFTKEWTQRISEHFLSSKRSLLLAFRSYQYLVYTTLFLLFFLALSGGEAGQQFLNQPGLTSLFNLLYGILQKLFSLTGLGALLSYGLIQLFFGAHFYKRYKARLQKRTQRFIKSLEKDLIKTWGKELDCFEESLGTCKRELESEIKMVSNLME